MKTSQVALLQIKIARKYFGGMYLKNSHAKTKRPITVRSPMHLVMRSDVAKGSSSLLRSERGIQRIIYRQGRRFGVKVYRLANAGNHLHMIILPRSRQAFRSFIKAIAGLIARTVLKVEKGKARGIKFWDKRPFTRILNWGRDYAHVCKYLLQNSLEAMGFVPYRPRVRSRLMIAATD